MASPSEPAALSNGTAAASNIASATAPAAATTTQGADNSTPTQPPIDHNRQMKSLNMDGAHADATVSAADSYAFQMGRARAMERNGHTAHRNGNSGNQNHAHGANVGFGPSASAHDDYDPDSNVYVANLPSDYGKERLYQLFAAYGNIVRYKFVQPDEASQPGYGFVQFAQRKDAHKAIKNLEGHVFATGESIYLSIALRRRSSLSDEPTNLYVKNLPSGWTNERLRKVFGAYGQIRQSKVVGDGIAFVRFEDHEQALNAIGRLDKMQFPSGHGGPPIKLEVRFATRKTAANAYRLQQVPSANKANENNLYIRNLPKFFNQSSLETLFANYGKISSAKINDNGIAFVRFAHAEDARRAIAALNGKKMPNFEEEMVVKLAHFDIGDSRNRWAQKFPTSPHGGHGGGHGMGGHHGQRGHGPQRGGFGHGPFSRGGYANGGGHHSGRPGPHGSHGGNFGNGGTFNSQMYQTHLEAPMGTRTHTHNAHNAHSMHSPTTQYGAEQSGLRSPNGTLHSAHSAHSMHNGHAAATNQNPTNGAHSAAASNPNPIANNASANGQQGVMGLNTNLMGMGAMNGVNGVNGVSNQQHTLQALQQQMQQWNLGGATGLNTGMSPLSMTQFAFPNNLNGVNGVGVSGMGMPINSAPNLFAQTNSASTPTQPNLLGAAQKQNGSENGSPQPRSPSEAKTWSKRQQELGDKLYQKVFARTGGNLAPKITGMLIKMGDKKAQKCIDDEPFLLEQIQIAKGLLLSQDGEGMMMPHTPTKLLSPLSMQQQQTPSMSLANSNGSTHSAPGSLTQQLASIAFSSPMNTMSTTASTITPNSSIGARFQTLNTKAVTPTSNGTLSAQAGAGATSINGGVPPVNLFTSPMAGFPTGVTSLNGGLNGVNGLSGVTGVSGLGNVGMANGMNGMASLYQQLSPQPNPAGTASPKPMVNGVNGAKATASPMTAQQQQFLYTTIPNLGSGSNALSSLASAASLSPATAQQGLFTAVNGVNLSGTPTQQNVQNVQTRIQQSGWGLANAGAGVSGVIPTQNAPQFMQPAQFPRQ